MTARSCRTFFTQLTRCHCAEFHWSRVTERQPGNLVQSGSTSSRRRYSYGWLTGVPPQGRWVPTQVSGKIPVFKLFCRKICRHRRRRDPTCPIHHRWVDVDAASCHQLSAKHGGDGERIRAEVLEIITTRGKMQNPVTGSGGMLIGTVDEVGPESPLGLKPGDRVATLVSLTLTPLVIEDGLERWDGR